MNVEQILGVVYHDADALNLSYLNYEYNEPYVRIRQRVLDFESNVTPVIATWWDDALKYLDCSFNMGRTVIAYVQDCSTGGYPNNTGTVKSDGLRCLIEDILAQRQAIQELEVPRYSKGSKVIVESVLLSKMLSGGGIEVRVYFREKNGERLGYRKCMSGYYKMVWKDTLIGILRCRPRWVTDSSSDS
ncbi:hypothetical protein SCHPADRAFT_891753 [Schizopora paradoxa]|uniref:Uncharacterized protein n=1 Tax=Schizopora paradoxa TaxID=27342 RepID=A0A0H2RH63_9AGAM|nr:hypothetical protein SCHPADRAFT_891753 [Schizopora paradoxa]